MKMLHFGVDIEAELSVALDGELGDSFKTKYGSDMFFGGVFVIPDGTLGIRLDESIDHVRWVATGDETIIVRFGEGNFDGPEGTINNALRKMGFSWRTGLPSKEARVNKHRVRPGDFPYAGAGWQMDVFGGVSALFEESDDWVRERVSEMIADIMAKAVEPALTIAGDKDNRRIGQKYLLDDPDMCYWGTSSP